MHGERDDVHWSELKRKPKRQNVPIDDGFQLTLNTVDAMMIAGPTGYHQPITDQLSLEIFPQTIRYASLHTFDTTLAETQLKNEDSIHTLPSNHHDHL